MILTRVTTVEPASDLAGKFTAVTSAARCSAGARAYIAGILAEYVRAKSVDDGSIVLAYGQAAARGSFVGYQHLADRVLWTGVVVPGNIARCYDTVLSLGRLSYAACYRLVGRSWHLYEELADELPSIVADVREGWCKRCFI